MCRARHHPPTARQVSRLPRAHARTSRPSLYHHLTPFDPSYSTRTVPLPHLRMLNFHDHIDRCRQVLNAFDVPLPPRSMATLSSRSRHGAPSPCRRSPRTTSSTSALRAQRMCGSSASGMQVMTQRWSGMHSPTLRTRQRRASFGTTACLPTTSRSRPALCCTEV